jgi:hypothetical protein
MASMSRHNREQERPRKQSALEPHCLGCSIYQERFQPSKMQWDTI